MWKHINVASLVSTYQNSKWTDDVDIRHFPTHMVGCCAKKARWQVNKWEKLHLGHNLFEQAIPERGTQMKNRSDKTQDEDVLHHVPLDGIQRLCF